MKKNYFFTLLIFCSLFSKAQELPSRITIGLNGGLSTPLNYDYAFDSYALPGFSFGLSADYNFKSNWAVGLEFHTTSHEMDAQGYANDLLLARSRNFGLDALYTVANAKSFQHYLVLSTVKYNWKIGRKFVLESGIGIGVNSFITPEYAGIIYFDDPINQGYQQLNFVEESFGAAFSTKTDVAMNYKLNSRVGIRAGMQLFSSMSLFYSTIVTTSEYDNIEVFDATAQEVFFDYPATWLNFSLGLNYSFWTREEKK